MDTSKFLKELSDYFGKKVIFDMALKIKPFEIKHLTTVRGAVTKQDPNDKNTFIGYSFRVIELDDEVIVREIIEIKIQK